LYAGLVVVAACGTSRPVSLDGAVDAAADSLVCPPGETDCDGACVDTGSDTNNCGGCGVACPAGAKCSGGSCGCGVGANVTDCDGVCVNTATDPKNCGACGCECLPGSACINGDCTPTCNLPLTLCCIGPTPPACHNGCQSACVDTLTDNNNCGGCGQACDTGNGSTCQNGSCSCVGGMTDCGGKCVNLGGDSNNCGSCGNQCQPPDWCDSGVCCFEGIVCNGVCIYGCQYGQCLQSSNENCGSCGNKCDTSNGFTCQGGVCNCLQGFADCNGKCVDLQTDAQSCGACGCVCATGSICSGGACWPGCPTGQTPCCVGPSQPGCKNCPAVCVALQTDPYNCGTCGNVCPTGQTCTSGTCT